MVSQTQIFLRLLVGAVLGGVIGFERELHDQPAGLRTHMILVIGATLAMVLSVNLGHIYGLEGAYFDPARLAAQVISGIGFLGAGAILRYGYTVRGLTTATSLWTMAIVGLTVGAGYYLVGVLATLLMLFTLSLVNVIANRFVRIEVSHHILIEADYRKDLVKTIKKTIKKTSNNLVSFKMQKNVTNTRLRVQVVMRMSSDESLDELIDQLFDLDGVRNIKVE
ncbi:MAG: MgtC/SapB family protein [Chloroflexi bacterium]|jgi:putative Mg2+ transporter-C (MgtC) family protein|nr:MgtC/SapB family protein [Chloroflexota bacterium]